MEAVNIPSVFLNPCKNLGQGYDGATVISSEIAC